MTAKRKKMLLIAIAVLLLLVVALGAAALGIWVALRRSLPTIDGQIAVRGLHAQIRIERDDHGVPTIRAGSGEDLAFGLGFVHGQDRFFQMDALRRYAAGELAEVLGEGPDSSVLKMDRRVRVFRFRSVAREVVAKLEAGERRRLDAYVEGVRAGLGSLPARPFEYFLLGEKPKPWLAEDSVLVMLSLFIDLQGDNIAKESARGVLRDVLPAPLAEFLSPRGMEEWDAPLFGGPIAMPPVPPRVVFAVGRAPSATPAVATWDQLEDFVAGSNNWALAGSRTADGRAWLANDMHLHLQVPGVWYRARLERPDEDGSDQSSVIGVTVPGGPGVVVGSNGRVAWGFTNTQGDWSDLIELKVPANSPNQYASPEGLLPFDRHPEIIKVKGGDDVELMVEGTIWGPVIDEDHQGRKRALRWVACDSKGVDLGLMDLASSRSLEDCLDRANRCGAPHQNIVVVDGKGRIGWTILGRLPRRKSGFGGRFPSSWADGSNGWDGYHEPSQSPRLVDPPTGQIWTANARIGDAEVQAKIGDGGPDRGARAKQIRDRLTGMAAATPEDLLDLQLDDRALFLGRWRTLLLDLLTPEVVSGDARRLALRDHVENWGGRASVDSVGYRMVWEFRLRVVQAALTPLTGRCRAANPEFRLRDLHTLEGPAWALVSQRPAHLLDPRYATWEDMLIAQVDAMLANVTSDGATLADWTWGRTNTAKIRHPLSEGLGWLSRWLDMPAEQLPGGWSDMPRIQGPDFGASERIVVSPGAEGRSFFHMPCGQSGHPLSPFYRMGHDDWVKGRRSPLLPGSVVGTLTLIPSD